MKNFLYSILSIVVFAQMVMFTACGDDSGSNSDAPEKIELVSSIDDLEKCTDEFEGNSVFVKEEKSDFVCQKGKWTNVDTQNSSSSSRVYEPDSGANIQPEVVKIKNKSISGVSQKGPFVTGSIVKLYELDGKTLASTGKNFPGKIVSDDGKFSVSNIDLESQYALLEANGYFRNELTGEKSNGVITLNALTDLSDRKSVNINLLTHLEYDRVLYLIGTGISVSAAKKQAESEILKAFGIKENFANSEDLDIFSKGDGNAALLAISVLMLSGNLNAAGLTERMTKFAMDIEKDGSWDDEKTKAEIADWAWELDMDELEFIRSRVEKWNLGDVPEFEKYVRNFWRVNYGLENCDKTHEGVVEASKNENSYTYDSKIRFICKDGVWTEASDKEKDFYKSGKDKGDDGELWTGLVTGNVYTYDETLKKWFFAGKKNREPLELNGCTTRREGEVGKSGSTYYICDPDHYWRNATTLEYDTYGVNCTSAEVGEIINGRVTTTNKYYCTIDGWVFLVGGWSWDVPVEVRLNLEIEYGEMTDTRDGQVYKTVVVGEGAKVQTWMAENLNFNYNKGTAKSFCYINKEANCAVTGRLYTWAAAIDSVAIYEKYGKKCGSNKYCEILLRDEKIQGVCPDGWHLPIRAEWWTLVANVGGERTAGIMLKSTTGWENSGDGKDSYGFSAFPAGTRYGDGDFGLAGSYAFFWSSSESSSDNAYDLSLYYGSGGYANLYDNDKGSAISVRCLKDSN